jgi:hypothetical protein
MRVSKWSERGLAHIEAADEIIVMPDRVDHTPGPAEPIWVVRVGDELYVRSYRGSTAGWYRCARGNGNGRIRSVGQEFRVRFSELAAPDLRAQIDQAYRVKYGRCGRSLVTARTSDSAADTTLQLAPAG